MSREGLCTERRAVAFPIFGQAIVIRVLYTVIMMATSDKEMHSTDCPVCNVKYSDPKILPCAHLLCRDCLVSRMKTKTETLCPICRSDIVDPKHSNIKNCDAFADLLPTDHAMSAMVESLKIFCEKHVCHVHNNADAISLCLHCNVKLCQSCIEVHRKLTVTSFHKIETLATLTPERLAACRQALCSVHPDKTAELVCVDHNVLICQLCATAKHRTCLEVTGVSEVSEKYKQSLLEMESKLSAAESSLSQAITELEERLLKAEKSTNAALAEIDTTCDSLLKSVEIYRKRLKKLVTEENDKLKAAIYEQMYIISHKRVKVTSHQGLIKRVLQMANDNSLIAMITYLESRVNDLDTCLPQDTNSCITVTLKIDRGSISHVEKELNNIIEPIFSFATGTDQNTWMFHNNCGSNIVLSSNKKTAEVKNRNYSWNRVVMSNEPVSTNKLYEILVEQIDTQDSGKDTSGEFIVIGLCEDPISITLQSVSFERTFVGVHANKGISHCQWASEYSCPALKTVKGGSHLGVMVDTSHSLHVYVDGKDQGVMAKNVAQQCYAVFDLRYFLKKVSTLPVSTVL